MHQVFDHVYDGLISPLRDPSGRTLRNRYRFDGNEISAEGDAVEFHRDCTAISMAGYTSADQFAADVAAAGGILKGTLRNKRDLFWFRYMRVDGSTAATHLGDLEMEKELDLEPDVLDFLPKLNAPVIKPPAKTPPQLPPSNSKDELEP